MPPVHCEGGVQALPAVNEDAHSLQVQPTLPSISGPAVSSVEGGEERCGLLLPESNQPEAPPSHQQALPSVQVDQTGPLSARHSSRERLGSGSAELRLSPADVNALNLSALRDSTGSSSGRESFGQKDSGRLEDGGSDLFYEADDGLEQKQTLQGWFGWLFSLPHTPFPTIALPP
jgi:hypothetical protein